MAVEVPASQVKEDGKLGPFGPGGFGFWGEIGGKVVCFWRSKLGKSGRSVEKAMKIWVGHRTEWKRERKGLFSGFEDPTK